MSASKDIQKAELSKLLKDTSVEVIEGKDLSYMNLEVIDFTGRTLKNCDISNTGFDSCPGLPNLEDCKSGGEKATDIMIIKSKTGNITVLSMIRGNQPYYLLNGKECGPSSVESAMITQARKLSA